jgi:hypothetical protein
MTPPTGEIEIVADTPMPMPMTPMSMPTPMLTAAP